jgi:fatty-acid desaturase
MARQNVYSTRRLGDDLIHGCLSYWSFSGSVRIYLENVPAFDGFMVGRGVGVGMGYHRLLTHRGYKTPKWMEYVLTICGARLRGRHRIGWNPFSPWGMAFSHVGQ